MRFSEIFAEEFRENFDVEVNSFPFKIVVTNNKIDKIVFETEIDEVSCVYTTGDKNISCSKKGLWFKLTPHKKLKDIIKKEPSAIKNLFKNNKNLIFGEMREEQIQNFKERNSFLFK
jgi:hypothetical protein